MSAARWKEPFGWLFYLCSAAPFIAFVVVAFTGNLVAESARIVIVNALIFAAAGVTAVLVKNMAFNAVMAVNAYPYAAFLFGHRGDLHATWSADDTKGSVVHVSIYCMIGMASTAVWLLIRADAIWRRMRRPNPVGGAPPPDP